jgi:hypothetical protein
MSDKSRVMVSPSLIKEGGVFVSIQIEGKQTEHLHFDTRAEWDGVLKRAEK